MSRKTYPINRTVLMATMVIAPLLLFAQPNVKVGIAEHAPNELRIDLLPDGDFDGMMSSATITVRFATTPGVSLGAPTLVPGEWPAGYTVADEGTLTDGGFTYHTYTLVNAGMVYLNTPPGYGWTGGVQQPFFTVPVSNNSATCVNFELIDDQFQIDQNKDWYITLNGLERTDGYIGGSSSSATGYPVWNTSNGNGFCSIQAAIADAGTTSGHTISVNPGTYAENVNVNKDVTLLGANANSACGSRGAESVIAPVSGLPVNIGADGVTINGFEITAPNYQYAVLGNSRSDLDISFNHIHHINSSATPVITNTHAIQYTVGNAPMAAANVNVSDNCFNNIGSSNLTGNSASAIGFLQSTTTGTLTGLTIERNTIGTVHVSNASWPTGKIAYGIQLNAGGGGGYLTTTGKIVDAQIADNEISDISGHIATGIGLEGNTQDAIVTGNKVSALAGTKNSGTRAGGGYDLNALKFENNRYVATVTVENNSFDTESFTHSAGASIKGYAVANYVPAGVASLDGTTGAADVTCNWFGTNDPVIIIDNASLTGRILNKDDAGTDLAPFLSSGTETDVSTGFQPTGGCDGGFVFNTSLVPVKNYATIQGAIDDPLTLDGHIIEVWAGVYEEQVNVTKALDIRGPNHGVHGNDSRVDEAIIVPPSILNANDPWNATPLVTLGADGISFDGFMISGDNTSIDGLDHAGMDVEINRGIRAIANDVTFSNNIVRDFTYIGFHAHGGFTTPHFTGLLLESNKFMNIHDSNQLGYGFAMYVQATAGEVSGNVVIESRAGLQVQPYTAVEGTTPSIVSDNTFSVWRQGIYYNYTQNGASAWTISDNTITATLPPVTPGGPVLWEGLRAETMYASANGGTLSNNVIDGTGATTDAINWWGVWGMRYTGSSSTSSDVHFTGNTVSNVELGFVHDALADIVLSGNTIDASQAAISVQRNYSSAGAMMATGGEHAIDATAGNILNGINTTGATLADLLTVEDAIDHKVDEAFRGLVRVKAAEIFVTQNSGSIQRGHDAADANDIVHVGAGTFIEELVIEKTIDLRGANYGVSPNDDVRGPESILMPSVSDPDYTSATGVSLMYIDGGLDGLSVNGLLFDGDNPALTSTLDFNGANIDVVEAFSSYDGVANTSIKNNIFKNIGYGAIDLYNYTNSGAATSGNLVNDNLFQNINDNVFGFGVLIYNNCYTAITDNVFEDVRIGIQTGNFYQADPGDSHEISGNAIESIRLGIFHNLQYSAASMFEVADNVITTSTFATNNNGIAITSHQTNAGVNLHDNSIDGATNGYNLWNNPTTNTITVVGGTVTDCAVGIFANNYDGYSSNANTSSYVISGVSISNSSVADIHVKDNSANTNGATVTVSIDNGTTLNSGSTGLRIEGAGASAEFIGSPALTGHSTYIEYVTNSVDVPSGDMDATGVLFDGVTGASATLAQNFSIEDKIVHKMDDGSFGLVRVKTGELFTTTNTAGIQNAINTADVNDIVNVQAGTYAENVNVNKDVTLLGANANSACAPVGSGSIIAPASGLPVNIGADGVTINGFEITAPNYQYAILGNSRSDLDISFNHIHHINSSATPVITNTHAIQYTVGNAPMAAVNVNVSDNCFNNIGSSNLTGNSASAIGFLQSTTTGTLTGLTIERNTIGTVHVSNASWPTGKIAYGIQLNAGGGGGYLTTTGKIVDAQIADNEISDISGHIATGIGLEGNTQDASVTGNKVSALAGTKNSGTRAGGGYDLNALKFENNRYVATVTVENNSFDTESFTHSAGASIKGYAVANYVPAGVASLDGTTGAADVTCNWFGTNDPALIADNGTLTGRTLSKDGAITEVTPYITSGTDVSVASGFQPQPGTCSGIWPVLNVNTSVTYPTIGTAVDAASAGDTLLLADHVFNERVVLDKSLTLRGTSEANTILDGSGLSGAGRGIAINNGITEVTITDMTIRNFAGTGPNQFAGIYGWGGNHDLLVERVTLKDNVGGSGFYANGPVDNVTLNDLDVSGHTAAFGAARGIVIWNGLKSNITITDCDVYNNNCCGIELQDGTASGVVMTGNNVYNNGDNGMGLTGLNGSVGANLIQGNTLSDNGRYGIEVKLPEGNGTDAGQGSILVENNLVTFNATPGMDNRDHAGIAVFRRGMLPGNTNNNADIPIGVVVRNNTVNGYVQMNPAALGSEGFGIVIEGVDHVVTGNSLSGNDVALQIQGGGHPAANYAENTGGDGDQGNGQSPNYFGRGNSPYVCNLTTSGNTFSSNTIDERVVTNAGVLSPGAGDEQKTKSVVLSNGPVSTTYCSIQYAVDKSLGTGGEVISPSASTFAENVLVDKSVSIIGAGQGQTIIVPAFTGLNCAGASICPGSSNVIRIAADDVTISDLTVDGDNPELTSGTVVGGADLDARNGIITDHTLVGNSTGLTVTDVTVQNIYLRGIYSSTGGAFTFSNNTVTNVRGEAGSIAMMNFGGSGIFTDNTVSFCSDGIVSNQGSGVGSVYSGNTITDCGSGIHSDNWNGPGTEQIFDNSVTNGTEFGYGIWAFASYAPISIHENTVSDMYVGLMHAGSPGVNGVVTFNENEVNNSDYGFYQTTSLFGFGNTNAYSLFTNNSLAGGEVGITMETHATRTRTLTANENSITGFTKGAELAIDDGASTDDLSCNWWGVSYSTDVAALMDGATGFEPWLVDGTDDSGDHGFQPVDGSCSGVTEGCMDPLADNFEPTASIATDCDYCEETVTNNTSISTPIVIGSGLPADNAAVGVRCNNMEVGLTAFERFVGPIVPVGNVYTTHAGNSPTSSSDPTPAAGTARWNYLLSVNLGDRDFTEVNVFFDVDFDPSAAVNFTTIDVSAFMASQSLETTSIAQSSENLGFTFWTEPPFNLSFDPFSPGTYDMRARLVSPETMELLLEVPIQVVVLPAVQVGAIALLDGPYVNDDDLMSDGLRSSLMPSAQPYNTAPWNYNGTETMSNAVRNVTGANAIVDWVLIELRDANAPATILHTRAALLQRDGNIVDIDGVNPVTFLGTAAGDYYVAVRHRNHLGVMTQNTVTIGTSTAASVDLTTMATYGTNATKLRDGKNMLWAGNTFIDDRLKYTGSSNDRDFILAYMFAQLGSPTVTSVVTDVYHNADVTMDGLVKYANAGNDRDPILVNIGGVIATAMRIEQLP